MRTRLNKLLLGIAVIACAGAAQSATPLKEPSPRGAVVERLYVLDCGFIKYGDPAVLAHFGVTLEDVGGRPDMPVSCYLIRHGSDWLMFDGGNGDWRRSMPEEAIAGAAYQVPNSVADQLKAIGVTPADIDYLAISHFHSDHVGNVAMFPGAKLLIQRAELEATLATPSPFTPPSAVLRLLKPGVVAIDGALDVFGDNSVVLEPTPGHTPGHQSLVVRLRKTGPVILTGDLYHYAAELRLHKMSVREQASEAPASRARIDALARREHAQIWIGHDIASFALLKKAPDFYE